MPTHMYILSTVMRMLRGKFSIHAISSCSIALNTWPVLADQHLMVRSFMIYLWLI